MKLRLLLFALFLISTTTSFAQNTCVELFSAQSAAVQAFVQPDAYAQWRIWEQTANVEMFRKSTAPVELPLAEVTPDTVIIRTTSEAPADLVERFKSPDGLVYWPKHPYNTSAKVPFIEAPTETTMPVYLSSSRSLILDGKLRGFTIKLATDYPHGPYGEHQPGKIHTDEDIKSALIHTNHIKKIDHLMGPDEKVLLLGEVMTMAEKYTGIGMVVRDVRLLADGHYYLPALSIPYVGREIAKLNNMSFEDFFQKYYAELLGEAKARLLLRYGLQMETPNSQNMLIQFDREMRPTGKIVFRDISDAFLVKAVAEGLGYESQIKRDIAATYEPVNLLQPYWSNSSWRFDEAPGAFAVSKLTLSRWGRAHNTAYLNYLRKNLGLTLEVEDGKLGNDKFPGVLGQLASPLGQKRLREYRNHKIQTNRAQPAVAQAS